MSATMSPTRGIIKNSPVASPKASPSGPGLPAGANVIPQTTSSTAGSAPVPVGELWARLQETVKKVDDYERKRDDYEKKQEAMIKDLKTKTNEQDEVINQFKFQFELDKAANLEKEKDVKTIKDHYKKIDEIIEEKFRNIEGQIDFFMIPYKFVDIDEKFENLNKKFEETGK